MAVEARFACPGQGDTVFIEEDGTVRLDRLFGQAWDAHDGAVRARGMAVLDTSLGRFEADRLALSACEFGDAGARFAWDAAEGALRLASAWTFCRETGAWSRKDSLRNAGAAPVTIHRCQARFALPRARYEVYSQVSRWCNENQGAWRPLHGGVVLGGAGGWSAMGQTPYACLRETGSDRAVAFHVLPRGNWTIRVQERAASVQEPNTVVELGMADEDMHFLLEPGGALALPEILVQHVPQGRPHLAAPRLHQFLLANHFKNAKPDVPVAYNTWFDRHGDLAVPRLREQLAAAKEVGCEVFVIDAGWYGPNDADWWTSVGDWREKTDKAFHGRMKEFADEVCAAGLGFGLWMEPERFAERVSIVKERPEWFAPAGVGAGWDTFENTDLDFAVLAALTGQFALSGDLVSLPEETRERLRFWVAFFKEWRGFIAGSVAHLLTEPRPKTDRAGWAALQLQDPHDTTSLLFTYRLAASSERKRFTLRDMTPDGKYTIHQASPDSAPRTEATGAQLMADGLPVHLPGSHNAARLLVIRCVTR